ALHAEGALLHDAATADGDVRVEDHGLELGLGLLRRRVRRDADGIEVVVSVIETPNLVRAVVGAVPRANAAVVDHVVQAFGRVHGGTHRADLLARRVLALLAHDWLLPHRRRVLVALVVALDADPRHFAAASHLVPTNDRDVVLGLASHDAGAAARALVEVDGQAPLVAIVRHGARPHVH